MFNTDLLLWLDFETTGLDFTTLKPLEIGVILTYSDGRKICGDGDTYIIDENLPHLLSLPKDDGARRLNRKNGLEDVMQDRAQKGHSKTLAEADAAISTVVEFYKTKDVYLAGSGIAKYDARIIEEHMTLLAAQLHYAPIDMGIARRQLIFAGTKLPDRYPFTKPSHRALEDAQQALDLYLEISPKLKGLTFE